MEISKHEQYVIYKAGKGELDDNQSAQIEKSIAGLYSSEGRINFIIDLTISDSVSDSAIKLFGKVQRICSKESGLLVLVTTNDSVLDFISTHAEEFLLFLPTVDEAIDAISMNDMENDYDNDGEDEFGFDGENDY
ncbi:MAG: hypothetical protein U0V04_04455 [Spirosomataceae bacterium]|jgi:anti-anti-sigma regulatory factor|nr:hypothetical protein [Bacteroidota bacterium]